MRGGVKPGRSKPKPVPAIPYIYEIDMRNLNSLHIWLTMGVRSPRNTNSFEGVTWFGLKLGRAREVTP